MKIFEFKTPEYLFCEEVIKINTLQDYRAWIYCPKALSLIEFVAINLFPDFIDDTDKLAGNFYYKEPFKAYWSQNNCKITNNNEQEILEGAWNFYKNNMVWEDEITNVNMS